MKKLLCFCFAGLIFNGSQAFGQGNVDVEEILQAGLNDLNTYMGYYVEPAAKGFMYSMGSGWAQTAKTHGTLGFDLKFAVSGAAVPGQYETFSFNPAEFEKIRVKDASGPVQLPTLYGNPNANGTLQIYEGDLLIAEADIPPGIDIPVKYVPAPLIQGAVGLPAGFEIIGRFIPKTTIEDTEISQWGLGIKHDIKQYFEGINIIPVDFSLLVAYNSLDARYYINEVQGQVASMNVDTWTVQGLVSKKISILTVYGSIGYNSGSSDYSMRGTYQINGTSEQFVDPVQLDYEAKGAMGTLGARLKFGPIFLNGDYTFQEFNTVNVGLGVSIK
ncbi:hypothetical protein DN752_15145 [Echinicola strongylocentroti]|uniref:Outer membrane protein beta-barrel domain-containing protein n=1 Tax=Echinicola strongylocentroti TaxID=1795355 RepID=A0A2Z4IKW0_9BACT|nr:DUF6588 family protein [Echinicola strongylocentroti]AWW31350.1 hypothetical protein DN752_15145 [Echinicola strongylocentroti]